MNVRLAVLGDYVEPVATWSPLAWGKGSFSYVDLGAVDQIAKEIVGAATLFCSEAPSRARQLIKSDDVLVSTVRPNLNGVAVVTAEYDGATASTGFCVLRPKPSRLLSKYLVHWVRSPQFVDSMVRQATGASYPAVTDRIVKSSLIPLPPLDEQRRIAAILDKADALRRKRRISIKCTQDLRDSYYLMTFGDPIKNERDWVCMTLGQALERGYIREIQDGNHGERHPKVTDFVLTGIPFITANCLTDGSLRIEDAYKLDQKWLSKLRVGFTEPGDLLMSHKGSVGDVAIVPPEVGRAVLSPQVTYYRVGPELNARFLLGSFRTKSFQMLLEKSAEQSTRAYIGITRQRELPIILPPLALQNEFSATSDRIDGIVARYRAQLIEIDRLYLSVQSQAFSGQL